MCFAEVCPLFAVNLCQVSILDLFSFLALNCLKALDHLAIDFVDLVLKATSHFLGCVEGDLLLDNLGLGQL